MASALHRLRHHVGQIAAPDWFRENSSNAGIANGDSVTLPVERRRDDEVGGGPFGMRFDAACKREAVFFRHEHVDDHRVIRFAACHSGRQR